MEIKTDINNELMKRHELVLSLKSENSPSYSEVRKQIAEKTGKPEGNIEILSVKGRFGEDIFEIEAQVYNSKDDLDKTVNLRKTKKQKKEEAEAAKKPEEKNDEEEKSEETKEN